MYTFPIQVPIILIHYRITAISLPYPGLNHDWKGPDTSFPLVLHKDGVLSDLEVHFVLPGQHLIQKSKTAEAFMFFFIIYSEAIYNRYMQHNLSDHLSSSKHSASYPFSILIEKVQRKVRAGFTLGCLAQLDFLWFCSAKHLLPLPWGKKTSLRFFCPILLQRPGLHQQSINLSFSPWGWRCFSGKTLMVKWSKWLELPILPKQKEDVLPSIAKTLILDYIWFNKKIISDTLDSTEFI